MLQRYDMCPDHTSAKILCKTGSNTRSVHAYGQTVLNLACVADISAVTEALLKSPPIKRLTVNANNIVVNCR